MRIAVITLFPELFEPFLATSFVGKAVDSGALEVHLEQLRDHGLGKHQSVDDTPYGGGSGMVIRVDCVIEAAEHVDEVLAEKAHRVLLTPQGKPLTHARARALAELPAVALVCGRYEGFDERAREFVHEEVSMGDFVLTGGEVAAMAVIESVVRMVPGVLGNEDSAKEESFSPCCDGRLEYPQYTRPASFRGLDVPAVLTSGDHNKIAEWRQRTSVARTRERRPDILREDEGE